MVFTSNSLVCYLLTAAQREGINTIPTEVLHHSLLIHCDYVSLKNALWYVDGPLLGADVNVALIISVCKVWSKAGADEYFWENFVKTVFKAQFLGPHPYEKPPSKTWKWTSQSKRPLSNVKDFTGIGANTSTEVCSFKYEGEWVDGKPDGFGCSILDDSSRSVTTMVITMLGC